MVAFSGLEHRTHGGEKVERTRHGCTRALRDGFELELDARRQLVGVIGPFGTRQHGACYQIAVATHDREREMGAVAPSQENYLLGAERTREIGDIVSTLVGIERR